MGIASGMFLTGLCIAIAAGPETKPQLVQVQRIWDRAPHNAFTDLIRFRGRWYCSFREGRGHAAGAGAIRVLTSEDGRDWQSAARIEKPKVDLRDPKLSVTPDDRLMIVGGAAFPATRDPVTDHYSFVCFSRDGTNWTPPEKVLESWHWLWRVTWHQGKAYGVAYGWDPKAGRRQRNYRASLWQSSDGRQYRKLADFNIVNPTEATLRFAGETLICLRRVGRGVRTQPGSLRFAGAKLICLQRRDGRPNSAMLGVSEPPYRHWTWSDLGRYFGGPNFLHVPGHGWWACGRIIDGGKAQTVLCRLDVTQGKLIPALTLPSGGDTSYPGMVWHDGRLWISYYSSHQGKTSIYLAQVRLP